MLKLVIGSKGKGKTKYMLETANNEAKTSDGLVIYLDKNSKGSPTCSSSAAASFIARSFVT